MEGDADGFKSEKMEGEREDGGWSKISEGDSYRVQTLSEGKQKKEKTKGIFKKIVLITVGSDAAFFKNAASYHPKKNAEKTQKNATSDQALGPAYKTRLGPAPLGPVF